MRRAPLALLPLLVALPGVAALGLPVDAPAVPQLPTPALPDVSGAVPPLPVEVPRVDVSIPLPSVLPAPAPTPDNSAARQAPDAASAFLQRSAEVAQHASEPALLTFLLSLYAAGADGLRALGATRLGSGAGRVLRAFGRVVALPLAALFSRIQPDHLLDQPTRARLHDAVVGEPGLTLQDLQRRAGAGWGATVRHVERLERGGLLVSVHQGGKRLFFAANTPASRSRDALAALAQPTARGIARLVCDHPGIDQVGVCAALSLRNPAASKQLARLAGLGLVESRRDGRRCAYHPTAALLEAVQLLPPSVAVRPLPALAAAAAAA